MTTVRPYYVDDTVTLHHGDCRDVLPELAAAGQRFECAVVDPPYGETSLAWDKWPDGWPGIVAGITNSMWCFGSMRMFLDRRDEFDSAGWTMSQDVVWRKQNGTGFAADRFRRVHEHATHWYRGPWGHLYKESPRTHSGVREPGRTVAQGKGHARHLGKIDKGAWVDDGTRLAPSVIETPNMWRRGAIHPTEKPVSLLDQLIRYACPPGGTILDCFAGSGSTAEAARLSGRRAVLVEGDKEYCEAIARRMAADVLPIGDGGAA